MYAKFFKRFIDLTASAAALLVLSPILLILIVVGAIVMKGNPFFLQPRPGKKGKDGQEKIFNLIKLRTMTNARGADGELLPDEQRLGKYGKWLRSTSADELPSLVNIFVGDLSLVGPRPLLVRYLPRYTEEQRHRHDVRPGLTGLAQVSGRNAISWEEKFNLDLAYVNHVTFIGDVKIILATVKAVFTREGISSETSATMEEFMGTELELTAHE